MTGSDIQKTHLIAPAEDLLAFVRLMQAAQATKLSFPKALGDLARLAPEGAPRVWATELSEKMARGHSLAEAIRSLEGIDPTMATLLAVPGGFGFESVLMAYARYLVLFERLAEQVRTALCYPLVMLWLGLGNIILLNMHVFPSMQIMFDAQHIEMPIVVKLLSLYNPDMFPYSLPLPLFIAGLTIAATRVWFFVPPSGIPYTMIGKLLALPKMALAEQSGRFQYLIALFLRAGCRITDAVRLAAGLGMPGPLASRMIGRAETLERGEDLSCTVAGDDILLPVTACFKGSADASEAAGALELASEANVAAASRLIGRIETVGLVAGLFLVGAIVLLLCLAFFDPYFTLVRGMNG
ncbi:MAG TPA: type II secretion system F family protein [Candidatus Ozemobacteraceae bacterium]